MEALDYLPDWTARQFHLFDPEDVWAPLLSRELADRWAERPGVPRVTGCIETRQLLAERVWLSSAGLILFFDGHEKECLSLLSRLMDYSGLPIAAALKAHHQDLIPVLLESGVQFVMMDPVSDVPLADWCLATFDLKERREAL